MQASASGLQQHFFELFGLPARYHLDNALLDRHYHALQAQFHPDKLSLLSEAERRASMQSAARVNEAYQTLRSSTRRACYLLALHGVNLPEETSLAMSDDFLMQQMGWREAIADAQHTGDAHVLVELETRLQHEMRELEEQLAVRIDSEQNYADAAEEVHKLSFLEKLAQEIANASGTMQH